MSKKISLGIIFGGRSVEHEVSILTGQQVIQSADRDKYEIVPIYLDRDNLWYIGKDAGDIEFFRQKVIPLGKLNRVFPCPDPRRGKLSLIKVESGLFRKRKPITVDCVIPACHGTFGEDGALQGLLEMANVPYAGSNLSASAVGMNKIIFKAVLKSTGLPCLPYLTAIGSEWQTDPEGMISKIDREFSQAVFIKPAVLGSSVGISRADSSDRLRDALELAFQFGDRVLIEPAVDGGKEINCSVVDGDPPLPSILEQPVSSEELLTFDEKYKGRAVKGSKGTKGSKAGKGMAAQQRLIPAPLEDSMTAEIQDLAVRTFQAVGAGGVARIDFLISSDGEILINELNNIPGSLSFYLWERMGKSFSELIDRMVERAYEVNKLQNRTTFSFEANLLAGE